MFYSVLRLYLTDTGSVLDMIENLGEPLDNVEKGEHYATDTETSNIRSLNQRLIIMGTTGIAGDYVVLNGIGLR